MHTPSLLPVAMFLICAGVAAHAQTPPTSDVNASAASAAALPPNEVAPEPTDDNSGGVQTTPSSDESPGSPRWIGTASIAVIAASGTRDLDDTGSQFGLALRARGEWRHDGWRALGETAFANERLALEDAPWLRQAWVSYAHGPLEWRFGRQILAWGRADRLNPTDNLSPRNLRALVSDIDEDRIGVDSASVRLQLGERLNITALHAPRMRATVLPASISTIPARLGSRRIENQTSSRDTQALRMDYAGNALDASLSIVDGLAVTPAFTDTNSPTLAPHALQPGVRIIGADFSAALGDRWGVRGEFARTTFDHAAPVGLGDFRYAVLGIERHIDGGWLVLAQWVHRRADRNGELPASLVAAINRPIWFQTETRSDALYLGLNRAQFEGDLSGNLGLLQTLDDRGRAWFANLTYRVDDRWNLLARWQLFSGPADSNIGVLRRDSLLLLELRGTWGGTR